MEREVLFVNRMSGNGKPRIPDTLPVFETRVARVDSYTGQLISRNLVYGTKCSVYGSKFIHFTKEIYN